MRHYNENVIETKNVIHLRRPAYFNHIIICLLSKNEKDADEFQSKTTKKE